MDYNFIIKLISENNLELAISNLLSYYQNTEIEKEIILLSSRYQKLMSELRKGTINHQDSTIENNKIIESLLYYCSINQKNKKWLIKQWDKLEADKKIIEIVNNNIEIAKNIFEECDNSNLESNIVDYYYVENKGLISQIGVTCTRSKLHTCHGCGVLLSFFEFHYINNNWILENEMLFELSTGSYGELNSNISIRNIGPDKYGIIIDGGFTNQGFTEIRATIYCNIAQKLKNIFSFTFHLTGNGFHGDDRTNIDAQIKFINNGNNFYDILLLQNGFEDFLDVSENIKYEFNGIEYVKSRYIL